MNDYVITHGTPIKATGNGVVVRAGWDTEYGNVVDIKHPNAVITRYAHAQAVFVKIGDVVKQPPLSDCYRRLNWKIDWTAFVLRGDSR
jgi:murein DD-endopeptidase MepM/ murein hydrolase activator NlpD